MNFAGDGQRTFGEGELAWLREFAAMAAKGDKDLFGRYRLLDTLMVRLKALEAKIDEEVEAASPLSQHEEIPPELREQWEEESKAAVMAEYRHRRAGFLTALQGWLRDVWLHARGLGAERARFPDLTDSAATVAGRITAREMLVVVRDDMQAHLEIKRNRKLLFAALALILLLVVSLGGCVAGIVAAFKETYVKETRGNGCALPQPHLSST